MSKGGDVVNAAVKLENNDTGSNGFRMLQVRRLLQASLMDFSMVRESGQ